MTEFKIFLIQDMRVGCGQLTTKLIATEEIEEAKRGIAEKKPSYAGISNVNEYFFTGYEHILKEGVIQVLGDDDMMDTTYTSYE